MLTKFRSVWSASGWLWNLGAFGLWPDVGLQLRNSKLGRVHSMKTLIQSFLLVLMVFPTLAQQPPLLRNQVTTNVAPWQGVLIQVDQMTASNFTAWTFFTSVGPGLFSSTLSLSSNGFFLQTNQFAYIQVPSVNTNRLLIFGGDSNLVAGPLVSDFLSNSNQSWFSTNLLTTLMATNNGSSSNVSLDLGGSSYRRIEIYLTNNITITNFSGLITGTYGDVAIHLIPQLIPRGIGTPTLGGASFGTFVKTNVNSPIFTTVTNGTEYVLSISRRGTNQFWSMSLW